MVFTNFLSLGIVGFSLMVTQKKSSRLWKLLGCRQVHTLIRVAQAVPNLS
jgi:hypothetical protein